MTHQVDIEFEVENAAFLATVDVDGDTAGITEVVRLRDGWTIGWQSGAADHFARRLGVEQRVIDKAMEQV